MGAPIYIRTLPQFLDVFLRERDTQTPLLGIGVQRRVREPKRITMAQLTTRQQTEILSSLFDAVPEDLKDEHTKQDDYSIYVRDKVSVDLNRPEYAHQRSSVTVRLNYPIEGKNKTWPVRKDNTVNVEGIMKYVRLKVELSLKKLARQRSGQALSKQMAETLKAELGADQRLLDMSLEVDTDSVFRTESGRVCVTFYEAERVLDEHGTPRRREFDRCDYYPDDGFAYYHRLSGLNQDQLVRILQIVRETGTA